MKKTIRKWTLRIFATLALIFILLLTLVLSPTFTYANKTIHHNFSIYHNHPLDPKLITIMDDARTIVSSSEFYNPGFRLDICLSDGSKYPSLIQAIFGGRAFARGFYNKVVLYGHIDAEHNFDELNGYKWNLTQLIAHEMMHCYQFDKLGLWKSKPVAKIDNWKWEGYAEYVARQQPDQKDLIKNIDRLLAIEKTENNGWIQFADGTGTAMIYYKYWIWVQYSLDVQKKAYRDMLKVPTPESTINEQMMAWYKINKAQ